ncbi:MAG: DUF1573 domain-containing protein [bacterium]
MKMIRNYRVWTSVFGMMIGFGMSIGQKPVLCASSKKLAGELLSGPVIEFESTTIDMGQAVTGKNVVKEVVFRNKGDKNLVIERINAG